MRRRMSRFPMPDALDTIRHESPVDTAVGMDFGTSNSCADENDKQVGNGDGYERGSGASSTLFAYVLLDKFSYWLKSGCHEVRAPGGAHKRYKSSKWGSHKSSVIFLTLLLPPHRNCYAHNQNVR